MASCAEMRTCECDEVDGFEFLEEASLMKQTNTKPAKRDREESRR